MRVSRTFKEVHCFIIFIFIMHFTKTQKILLFSGFLAVTAVVFKMAENKRTETQKVGPFIPTNEWQEVLPGQAVPKVIMNTYTVL